MALLLPIALAMGIVGLAAFLWSMRDGQYDDMDGAAERILLDDRPPEPQESEAPESGRPG
ncbi:cbb3-type cytochrome oxidase assembly protein CcoS [Neomegalonema sp.]|uniref:cbb3-type cytochrome oxidase assembly protein CcoS n=1 Tax=Neomegalonema sp. TaxID=2039713 RepID=UPI00261A82BE|nr:cbb3-type cytochrome oxidase assembly protein CcoS [Neomegalonema sp.]MDD2868314.1 cbb3-type cytochrome oxidase assembly protein CcoS [Neomegalonema sp.]